MQEIFEDKYTSLQMTYRTKTKTYELASSTQIDQARLSHLPVDGVTNEQSQDQDGHTKDEASLGG